MKFILLLIALLSLVYSDSKRPIIGIFTLPSDMNDYPSTQYSYLPASYIKQMEASGTIVIPISWEASYHELNHTIHIVDGILFTGGNTILSINTSQPGYNFNKFLDAASFIFVKVLELNKNGHAFPIMGTCQGLQLLFYLANQFNDVLSEVYNQVGVHRVLDIVKPESYFFKTLNPRVKDFVSSEMGPFYGHHWAVLKETYEKSENLQKFFEVTSYSQDGNGQVFIASAQARNLPIVAYQFHLERVVYEWTGKVQHPLQLVEFSQHLSNQFVQLARLSNHSIEDEELYKVNFEFTINKKKVIYNYQPIAFFGMNNATFVQIYFFDRKNKTEIESKQLGIKAVKKGEWKKQLLENEP